MKAALLTWIFVNVFALTFCAGAVLFPGPVLHGQPFAWATLFFVLNTAALVGALDAARD